MRGQPAKKMDRALAQKRWDERFTWKKGDVKIVRRASKKKSPKRNLCPQAS